MIIRYQYYNTVSIIDELKLDRVGKLRVVGVRSRDKL